MTLGNLRRTFQRMQMLAKGQRLRGLASAIRLIGSPDIPDCNWSLFCRIRAHTMTSPQRVHALIEAIRYIIEKEIPGAIAECGVWRGGSMMAVALTLLQLGVSNRELFLFDTFEGMPRPSASDIDHHGQPAITFFRKTQTSPDRSDFCRAYMDEVRENMASTGYPRNLIHLIKGKVEETIPAQAPQTLALLRLDTDWYESTKHELVHLYPRVARGGVLIIDDYGHWEGAKKATDEYLAQNRICIHLSRIDYTGRIGVKID